MLQFLSLKAKEAVVIKNCNTVLDRESLTKKIKLKKYELENRNHKKIK